MGLLLERCDACHGNGNYHGEKCPTCNGNGKDKYRRKMECHFCYGTGTTTSYPVLYPVQEYMEEICRHCHGTGLE